MYALATRPRELLGESWEKVVMVVGSVFMGVAILTWLAGMVYLVFAAIVATPSTL